MAYYITNANYKRMIEVLEFDIPSFYTYNYCKKSKVKVFDFELDLSYLPFHYAKLVAVSNKLFADVSALSRNFLIKRIEEEQSQWVYKNATPVYHADKGCVLLNSDYKNIRIPSSVPEYCKNEYRNYFKSNVNSFNTPEFCQRLKAQFNLSESLEDLEKFHIHPIKFKNSGVKNEQADLKTQINIVIGVFKHLMRDIDPAEIDRLYGEYCAGQLPEAQFHQYDVIFKKTHQLVNLILTFHFQYTMKNGVDISKKLFELTGFRPCRCCGEL